ncbi:MAG: type II toxin-antitoxin system YafQ family toxin [Nanoarchaeota archaeon]|nr:type II toxin-antitoxin system YafQ family toxin [Nanoarchaeota archaeon]
MPYQIQHTTRFKKDYKLAIKRGFNSNLLQEVIELLANGEPLPERYNDHSLSGNYTDYRECHIQPDWLLVYKIHKDVLILTLYRTGTHSDLF